ncbi:OmpA family protein [bacterium]|nr:OmpA family protein [Bacteroidales bacterium]MBD5293061.1 OmpA family protein [Bacteroides sp.]MBD5385498.1 OmpA family protein [bacterium]MDE7509471.1 OmpA family protein [Muribaculaceae bacterium]
MKTTKNIGNKSRRFGRVSIIAAVCAGSLMMSGCSALSNTWNGMSQTGQGASAGGAAGAAIGAGIGALIGGGRGTWIGALVGGALGAGTGAVVGNSMQRQKAELESQLAQLKAQTDQNTQDIAQNRQDIDANTQAINDIKVQMVKDRNDLDAIKLVMGDAVLFPTGKYALSAGAEAVLSRVAYNLDQFPDTDITVVGYTDNTGTEQLNQTLSEERAQSVASYLEAHGVNASRVKTLGEGWNDPIASNSTPEGRAQNRRVEIYITASQQMINNASASK